MTEHTTDPMAAVMQGDADPTGRNDPACSANWDGFWCTREPGHVGQHIAGDGETVWRVWPNVTDPMVAVRQTLAEMRARADANMRGDAPTYYAETTLQLLDVLDGVVGLVEEWGTSRQQVGASVTASLAVNTTARNHAARLRAVLAGIGGAR